MKLSPARQRQQMPLPLETTFTEPQASEHRNVHEAVILLRRRGHKVYRAGYVGQRIRHVVDGKPCTTEEVLARAASLSRDIRAMES